jgi:hypothetical protein
MRNLTLCGKALGAAMHCAIAAISKLDDIPESWRTGVVSVRSRDSHYYGQRFILRLDETTAKTAAIRRTVRKATGRDDSTARDPGKTGGFPPELAPRSGRTPLGGTRMNSVRWIIGGEATALWMSRRNTAGGEVRGPLAHRRTGGVRGGWAPGAFGRYGGGKS